mmetsp:Transcript_775/g.1380  ORF Transcript_775/g.1380 Transcript_775/m.1380 type:complete len:105 (+) Transcript_775:330-644(+)
MLFIPMVMLMLIFVSGVYTMLLLAVTIFIGYPFLWFVFSCRLIWNLLIRGRLKAADQKYIDEQMEALRTKTKLELKKTRISNRPIYENGFLCFFKYKLGDLKIN